MFLLVDYLFALGNLQVLVSHSIRHIHRFHHMVSSILRWDRVPSLILTCGDLRCFLLLIYLKDCVSGICSNVCVSPGQAGSQCIYCCLDILKEEISQTLRKNCSRKLSFLVHFNSSYDGSQLNTLLC